MSSKGAEIAIRAEGLGKLFYIGARQTARYRTFRETLMEGLATPFRRARSLLSGHATGAAELHEELWALRNLSFEVTRGEVVGVIGKNGAGKTTLLKVISRITEPTEGYVEIHGRVASLLEVGTGFHPELTGRENVFLNGAILGMHRSEIDDKFDEIVEFAEVDRFIDTPVKHYSSGMYVRLAFAVAAHLEPEILIVDEVLSVGDAAFQRKCLGKIGEVAKGGRTVLFVSHNMAAVTQLCTRTLLLQDGRVIREGDPAVVVQDYLAEGLSNSAVWDRPEDAESDGRLVFDSVRVLGPDGTADGLIPFDGSFVIELDYHVPSTLNGATVAFQVKDAMGTILWVSQDTDRDDGEKSTRSPGRYRARVQVPGRFLKPGQYSVTFGAYIRGAGILTTFSDALVFGITEVGWPIGASRAGVLSPALPWETESLSGATDGTLQATRTKEENPA